MNQTGKRTLDLEPYQPQRPLLGPVPPKWFAGECDGCTFSPDGITGIANWHDACVLHDWHYSENCTVGRWMADWYFNANLRICKCPRRWAWYYWIVVRLIGWRHYEKPKQ